MLTRALDSGQVESMGSHCSRFPGIRVYAGQLAALYM